MPPRLGIMDDSPQIMAKSGPGLARSAGPLGPPVTVTPDPVPAACKLRRPPAAAAAARARALAMQFEV